MEELVEHLVLWNLHPEVIHPSFLIEHLHTNSSFQVMVTNTFKIDEAEEAYKIFDSGKTGKCAIVYSDEKQIYRSITEL